MTTPDDRGTGPPKRRRPDPVGAEALRLDDVAKSTETVCQMRARADAPPTPSKGAEFLAQLRRRHDAARRMPPLDHSGRRDPARPHEICGWWR